MATKPARVITVAGTVRFTVFSAVLLSSLYGITYATGINARVPLTALAIPPFQHNLQNIENVCTSCKEHVPQESWIVPDDAHCPLPKNWVVGAVSVALLTEKYYDLTGAVTFFCVIGASVWEDAGSLLPVSSQFPNRVRSLLGSLGVLVWSLRLGTYLFTRIQREGKDSRFDTIKPNTLRFFNAWQLQATWVFLTSLPVTLANSHLHDTDTGRGLGVLDAVGLVLWAGGLLLEVVADSQKSAFRAAHPGQFINTGVWTWSRHPNYVGEIVLWIGQLVLASGSFTNGADWFAILSPVITTLLLTKVSGIPMLEKSADEKWGSNPAYQLYKSTTPVLFPFIRTQSSKARTH